MMIRRSGLALLVLGMSLAIGPRPAGAQPAAEPRPRQRFVAVPGHVINIDQVLYVEQLGQPGDQGRTEVYFARAQPLFLYGDAGRQLVTALRDANLAPAPAPRAEVPAPGAGVVAFDGFDGKLVLNWKPVRPDPTHVSLAKAVGWLTITTQRGSIHGTPAQNEAGADFLARNLYLIDNPLAPDADFTLTTRVTGFTPAMSYQQAGLIVYGDDDNYLKFGYEFNWGTGEGQTFFGVAETAGQPTHLPVESESGLKDYWLRLTRRGDRYEYASSLDGRAYRVHGTTPWAGTPARVGLVAKNGGTADATELDAHFDFFELRSLAADPAPADHPAPVAAVEPPIRLAPPIPLGQMTDQQLAGWIEYHRTIIQNFGNQAKAYRAVAAIPGDEVFDTTQFPMQPNRLNDYLRQRLAPKVDVDHLNATGFGRLADEYDVLVALCRERLAEAEAEQRTRRDATPPRAATSVLKVE